MAEGNSVQETGHSSPPEATPVKLEQENPAYKKFREYLIPNASRKAQMVHEKITPLLLNDQNRAVFTSEWANAIKSAKNIQELSMIMHLAYDPHQDSKLINHIKSKILSLKPELERDFSLIYITSMNPEYDSVRKAVGEKLQQLGISNSGINNGGRSELEKIFYTIHPSPYEHFTYTTYRTERVGRIFKKNIQVPVEEHGKRFRPYEELVTELLQYNHPQSTPAIPEV